jgi:glycosyltransferase involved in cell wall biosynthesis
MPLATAEISSPPAAAVQPLVAILLCTYQGEEFLAAQLNSIARQTHPRWKVWASDDGSRDRTLAILAQYRAEWGDPLLSVREGPHKGFVANFLSLVCNPEISADHFAFSDQDDLWEADKIERAVAWLETVPAGKPALYMSRTRLIDEAGADIGFAPLFTSKPPTFANAIVQNIGGGNTMVFNAAARDIIAAGTKDTGMVAHDWWSYMLVTGAGGVAYYDSYPSVRYRQHGANVHGSNAGLLNRFWRAALVFGGRFRSWSDRNIRSLAPVRNLLTPENQRIFDNFNAARRGPLPARILALKRSGVHRQGIVDNIGLYVAAFFNRL